MCHISFQRSGYYRNLEMVGCAAINCCNSSKNCRLFIFPSDPIRRAKWVQNMRRDFTPTRGTRLCEHHFENSQYEQARQDGWRKLKPNAVPILFDVPNQPPNTDAPPRKSIRKKIVKVEAVTDVPSTSGFTSVEMNGGFQEGGICSEAVNSKNPFFEVFIKEETVSDEECDDDYHSHLELDWKSDDKKDVKESAILPYDDEELISYGDGVGGKNEDMNDGSLFHSEVSLKIEEEEEGEEEELDCTRKLRPQTCIHEVNDSISDVSEGATEEDSRLSEAKKGHPCKKKIFACNFCSYSTPQMENLEAHLVTHTEERPFSCYECNASFSKKAYLQRHRRVHSGERPFTCDVCSASFTVLASLKTHKRIHTGEKPYICKICTTSFSNIGSLKTHERCHTGEKPFVCNVCSSSFSSMGSLKRHKRNHSGDKPYVCDVCSASFSESYNLKVHNRIHTGEKPYVCNVCSASFTVLCSLKTHKRVHTGEKPYVCDVCSHSFSHLSYLKTHRRIHTGERPYTCNLCPSAFLDLSHLKRHKRTHSVE